MMNKFILNVVSIMGIALFIPIGTAHAQSALELARQQNTTGPKYRYIVEYVSGEFQAKVAVDSAKPAGQRLNVQYPAPNSWSDDFKNTLRELDQNADQLVWCSQYLAHIPADAVPGVTSDKVQNYQFRPVPTADADAEEKKIMARAMGNASLGRKAPGLLSFEMALQKPLKLNLIAEIKYFSLDVHCTHAPDGRTRLTHLTTRAAGNAMMQEFVQTDTIRITDFEKSQ